MCNQKRMSEGIPSFTYAVKIALVGYFVYFLKMCRSQQGLRIVNRPWDFLFHSHFLIKVVSKSENVKNPNIANTLGKINI